MRKANKIFKEITTQGFSKIKLFSRNDIDNVFKKKIVDQLNQRKIIEKKFTNKNIRMYHEIIDSEDMHKKIIKPKNRQFKIDENIIKKIKKNKKIKNLIINSWDQKKYEIKMFSKNNIKNNFAGFRLARPFKNFKNDVGGEHIDLNFNNKIYKNQKMLFTIWVPIIGFNKNHTIRVAPLSHIRKHDVKYIKKQKKYISKVYKSSYIKNFKFKRFNMNKGDVIIFHPNLLHGASKNLGIFTRVSLDFRIFNPTLI